ncbi:hypothetical protein K435DRAFT_795128 [Dendrothele bispora CBS 962.96]|uniref:Uncharacterized protein n=1 Tax=Dendrothele bispora (strain CBS 962.96) TaxID=1314807 RepID=A0A4S8MA09_DENBC|nr:hypothetical protein K435DRAFT_795128 [Dendrothele bispora CBS 962.96]
MAYKVCNDKHPSEKVGQRARRCNAEKLKVSGRREGETEAEYTDRVMGIKEKGSSTVTNTSTDDLHILRELYSQAASHGQQQAPPQAVEVGSYCVACRGIWVWRNLWNSSVGTVKRGGYNDTYIIWENSQEIFWPFLPPHLCIRFFFLG